MKIALTGSSGFIATNIQQKLFKGKSVEYLHLKRDEKNQEWVDKIKQADILINLAGAPVIQRWTKSNRQTILSSRVETTQRLVSILNQLPADVGPKLFISASAIGIYPDKSDQILDEQSSEKGSGFLANVVEQWENEARELVNDTIRLVIARIGVVIGKDGGLIKKTLSLFKMGLGGKIASGNQALSFIHIDDIVNAIGFFIENQQASGIYNLVAPNISTNKQFTQIMGQLLKRPVFLPVPAFALKLIYGEAARIMINGEKVFPAHLLNDEFSFEYPTIDSALKAML